MKKFSCFSLALISLWVLILSACTSPQVSAAGTQEPVVAPATPTVTPDWFNMELTDVQTG